MYRYHLYPICHLHHLHHLRRAYIPQEDGLDSVVSIPASLGGNSQAGVVTGAAVGGPVAAPDGGDGYGDDMSAVTGPA